MNAGPRAEEQSSGSPLTALRQQAEQWHYMIAKLRRVSEQDTGETGLLLAQAAQAIEAYKVLALHLQGVTEAQAQEVADWKLAFNTSNDHVEKLQGDREAQDGLFQRHTAAVEAFLSDLYCIMVDPCAEGPISVEQMQTGLRYAAILGREQALEDQVIHAQLQKDLKLQAQTIADLKTDEKINDEWIERLQGDLAAHQQESDEHSRD